MQQRSEKDWWCRRTEAAAIWVVPWAAAADIHWWRCRRMAQTSASLRSCRRRAFWARDLNLGLFAGQMCLLISSRLCTAELIDLPFYTAHFYLFFMYANWLYLIMAALRSRCGHYILPCGFFYLLPIFFFIFSPNLSRRRLDVYHTSTRGVTLVRISDAGLKRAARGLLKVHDAQNRQKFAIWAPSHNFLGLYLYN